MNEGPEAVQKPVSTPTAPAPPQGPYLRPGAQATPLAPAAPSGPLAPPEPTEATGATRGRAGRLLGGGAAVIFVIALKLFAAIGVTHLLHGASAGIVLVVVLLVGFLVRYATRFLGR